MLVMPVAMWCQRGATLRCQHGSCSLMEVEQLLQEQDGLQETNASHDGQLLSGCLLFPGRRRRLHRSGKRAEAMCAMCEGETLTCNGSQRTQALCVCVFLHCWSVHARFHPWACCTLCLGCSTEIKKDLDSLSLIIDCVHSKKWLDSLSYIHGWLSKSQRFTLSKPDLPSMWWVTTWVGTQ